MSKANGKILSALIFLPVIIGLVLFLINRETKIKRPDTLAVTTAGFDASAFDGWYREVGAGMGASLNTAAGLNASILADRASWLNFGNKADLALLYSGDPVLFNPSAFLPVNPERHSHVRNDLALQLEEWFVSYRAAELINSYAINGETLFTFNATAK